MISNMATQQNIHIGQLIKSVFDDSGLSVAEFARRINCGRSNIYFIFERSSIDVKQLVDISNALNHNFFDDIELRYGIKSTLCPRQININLNISDLDNDKAARIARFLEELHGTDCQ
ncbi:MAG: helix-turn-helix transcriptional regulator [Salinivirgaceae bacterium]|nr:helix-turn-helix transcriptional regulator [Salinivirgaceae bacterium]